MEFKLEIKFGKSASQNYSKALKYLKKFNNAKQIDENNNLNTIILDKEELIKKYKVVESLWMTIGNWKTSDIHFNDKEIEFNELRELLQVIECSAKYNSAVIPENHCKSDYLKEGWGCKYLNTINKENSESYYHHYSRDIAWYHFGEFKAENIWHVNKDKIKNTLDREAKLKNLYLCEVFDIEKVFNIVDGFPDEIDVTESDYWDIEYEENTDSSTVEKRPLRIIPKNIRDNYDSSMGISLSFNDLQNDKDDEEKNKSEKLRYIPELSFSDIGGIDDILETIREVIEIPLKMPDLFKYLGIRPHKGILLYGPPGCGKTLIAKAIANEIKAHFISIKGPELLSKWHGQSEENLRNIFEEARELQPTIIYFDEIDSIAQSRSSNETLRLDSRFVNQLLTLMDGIEEYSNVCVIASTNRKELIDEAVLRPGRFDYTIEVKKPTKEGCFKIFTVHSQNMPIDKSFDQFKFSEELFGLSGAEIAFIAREGAYNCLRRNLDLRKAIENNMLEHIDYTKFVVVEQDFYKALNSLTGQQYLT